MPEKDNALLIFREKTRFSTLIRQSIMIYWSKANNFGEGGIQAMIWSKEETLPRSEIEAIQLTKLKETVRYIYDRVKPYRDKMDAAGVKPDDIRTLDDLRRLPFTYKADFRDNYPDGLFALDKKEIVLYHAS